MLVLLLAGGFVVRGAIGPEGEADGPLPDPPVRVLAPSGPDPFAYSESRRDEFERRAAEGLSHVLYEKSPGGVVASARRTARYRPLIERIARRSDLDPDLIEAIVLLESAGRPDAAADPELEGAVGLTQILAGTGQGLLAMRVDTEASRRLTAEIAQARILDRPGRVRRLEAKRRRVDQRFDPREALEGTARYLTFARGQLQREDLAIVSYHMGVGNLTDVIADFGEGAAPSYVRLYFDSTPNRHAAAYRRLASLGDDSATYFWRVLAARSIMRELRSDPDALAEKSGLHTAKASAEDAMHPPGSTPVYADPEQLEDGYRSGDLRPFPAAPERTGLRRARQMGDLSKRLGRSRRLYRGLRPEAYALALYLVRMVRRAGGGDKPLVVTSTVRDQTYQDLLTRSNPEATTEYSLHTTGWAFDIFRRYSGKRQAGAVQYALDRLAALNLITWVREPAAIHITVSRDAQALRSLLIDPRQ